MKSICDDQIFWKNRYIKKFGLEAVKYKPDEKTWKNHYLQVAIDLDRFAKNPLKFILYVQWDSRGEEYSWFFYNNTIYSFDNAEEWMKNNFYLLDIGPVNIYGKEVLHITPYEYSKKQSEFLSRVSTPFVTVDGRIAYDYLVAWRNMRKTQEFTKA
jgi:hypothetical protein